MLTVRLPEDLEREVERLAAEERTTKTHIIREALERYVQSRQIERSSFEVGEPLFGRYSSGSSDRSVTYKERLKKKLRAKHTH